MRATSPAGGSAPEAHNLVLRAPYTWEATPILSWERALLQEDRSPLTWANSSGGTGIPPEAFVLACPPPSRPAICFLPAASARKPNSTRRHCFSDAQGTDKSASFLSVKFLIRELGLSYALLFLVRLRMQAEDKTYFFVDSSTMWEGMKSYDAGATRLVPLDPHPSTHLGRRWSIRWEST
ncbi:hypothetical protein NDU88_005452 [Pleurodeles waltl]|uniref:Uncharacterized protein n=1 Tax=Pleurodeles waltl TaxID=8319 RepID=A0AAV7PI56_PLEWA|nr:hypothetical protein NDU88_005452 [Pleurodeles waltl]